MTRLTSLLVCCSLLAACTHEPAPPAQDEPSANRVPGDAGPTPAGDQAALAPSRHVKAIGQLGPGEGTLLISLKAPKGTKLTPGAPLKVVASGRDLRFPKSISTKLALDELPVRLPIVVADGAADPAEVELKYYYCNDDDGGSCQPEHTRLWVELDLSGMGPGGEAHFTYEPLTARQ